MGEKSRSVSQNRAGECDEQRIEDLYSESAAGMVCGVEADAIESNRIESSGRVQAAFLTGSTFRFQFNSQFIASSLALKMAGSSSSLNRKAKDFKVSSANKR